MSDQMEPTNDISSATETPRPQKLKPKVIEGGGGALAAENRGKSFKRRPVVRGVSMSVKRGEVVGPEHAGRAAAKMQFGEFQRLAGGLALGPEALFPALAGQHAFLVRDHHPEPLAPGVERGAQHA